MIGWGWLIPVFIAGFVCGVVFLIWIAGRVTTEPHG